MEKDSNKAEESIAKRYVAPTRWEENSYHRTQKALKTQKKHRCYQKDRGESRVEYLVNGTKDTNRLHA